MMVEVTTKPTEKKKNNRRSGCPISIGLESFGDKWTLLLIRDLISGGKRFKDFETGSEGIPTNILASRLKTLEKRGIIEKNLYQERPKRYEYKMLQKGWDMIPVLQEVARWTDKYCEDCSKPPAFFWDLTPTSHLAKN